MTISIRFPYHLEKESSLFLEYSFSPIKNNYMFSNSVFRLCRIKPNALYVLAFSMAILFHLSLHAQWSEQGSSPSKEGQVEGITDKEVAGAIHCVTPHPTNGNIVYIGAVSGGIWKTENASTSSLNWTHISRDFPSQCISALEFDLSDSSFQTLVAGIGRFSSFGDQSLEAFGIYRTTTGGNSWTLLDPNGIFRDHSITGLAASASTIVVATLEDGLWQTSDLGAHWVHLSGSTSSVLPAGNSFDLVCDPLHPNILYTNAGKTGIYKSSDMGSHWTKVSSLIMNQALEVSVNVKLAAGRDNNVFAAIVGQNGELSHLFETNDGGTNWQKLDLPETTEAGKRCGIHPGRQGSLHLSIAADPVNHRVVYLGGDRQVSVSEADSQLEPWPNSIGALDYSGRLFKVDASKPLGQQATAITHAGTQNTSAPHADSRDMDFDINGNLLEADDGGIFRRSNPASSSGDWFSLNGNLNVSEMHSLDWDANMDIIISGAQDIGTSQQETTGVLKWKNISTGDGGDVAVDDFTSNDFSTRYSSSQNLVNFIRSEWATGNVILNITFPGLINTQTGRRIGGFSFVAPIKIHHSDGTRLLVATSNALFESFDQCNTVTPIANIPVNADGRDVIVYGATDNADVIYVGSNGRVYIRSAAGQNLKISSNYRGGFVAGIAGNPENSEMAFVIGDNNVFQTTNKGSTWTSITGNLASFNSGRLHCIVYITRPGDDFVAVGTDVGIFIASGPSFNNWARLGTELPIVPVFDLDYEQTDNVLVAATMGMGAWLFRF